MDTETILAGLNPQQRRAAEAIDGPYLVVAGAGSGKTTVLSRRVAALISLGIDPSSILLLTFTRAAARNMIERAKKLSPAAIDVSGGTFHSIAHRLVLENHSMFRLPERPTILDPEDVTSAFRKIAGANGGKEENMPKAGAIARVHSYAVNTKQPIGDAVWEKIPQFSYAIDFVTKCAAEYKGYKRSRGLIDYDDLLVAWDAMMDHPAVGAAVRDRFRYVLVDEHQDSNAIQCSIIEKLGGDSPNVMAVGDPCQPPETLVYRVKKKARGGQYEKARIRVVEQVRIADLNLGDTIVGYSIASSSFFMNRKVLGKTERPYEGDLIVANIGERTSRYTPNHHCVASFSPLRGKIAVYLMRKGNRFRIGRAKMAYDSGPNGRDVNGSGPIRRAKSEKADALWILSVHDTDQAAAVAEYTAQCRFGITGLTFVSGYVSGGRLLDDEYMEKCWNVLSDVDLEARARECLQNHGRRIEHPIWSKDKSGITSFKRPSVYHACNLIDGCLMLPFDEQDRIHVRRNRWQPARITKESYSGSVYSLTVSHDQIYVADGIATHNCQSIYGFRGSAPRTMFAFKESWPDATVINLDTNYRSGADILAVANAVDRSMRERFERELKPSPAAYGSTPRFVTVPGLDEEASYIAEQVLENKENGTDLSEQAVLVRSMMAARHVEAEFVRRRIPYKVSGGIRISEAAHIKDMLCLTRTVVNVLDEPAWMRVLTMARGIGDKKAAAVYGKISELRIDAVNVDPTPIILDMCRKSPDTPTLVEAYRTLAAGGPPVESLDRAMGILEDLFLQRYDDWRTRKSDIAAVSGLAEKHDTLDSFLSTVTLDYSVDRKAQVTGMDDEEKPITVSTIHSAKGLEWDIVYIPSFMDGHMPSIYCRDPEEIEEEKRVLYVAVTRPRRSLVIVKPVVGRQAALAPESPFAHLFVDLTERVRKGEYRRPVSYSLGVDAEIDIFG